MNPRSLRRTARVLASAATVATGLLLTAAPALAAEQPPEIISVRSTNVTTDCATLHAQINPGGEESKETISPYRFEYVTEAQFAAHEFEEPEHSQGETIPNTDHVYQVHEEVCGLAPDTTYHFRATVQGLIHHPGEGATFTTLKLNGESHELISSFGSKTSKVPAEKYPLAGPTDVAVDQSTGDLYVTDPGVNEQQVITITATGGYYTLTVNDETTKRIEVAAGDVVASDLEELTTIGRGNVFIHQGRHGFSVTVEFIGGLAGAHVEPITVDTSELTGGTGTVAETVAPVPGHAVEKFSPTGEFLLMFGKGVDKTTGGNVCPEHPGDTCQPGTPGPATEPCGLRIFPQIECTPVTDISPGQLDTPTFLAVDNSHGPSNGDVYVADTATHLVQKFDPSGQIVSSWGVGGQKDGSDATQLPIFGPLGGIEVGPEGTLEVLGFHGFGNGIWRYTQAGNFIEANGNHAISPSTLAYDPSENEYYEDTGALINHYGPVCGLACGPIDVFGSGQLSGAEGVEFDPAIHLLYVANTGAGDVLAFADVRPRATTGSPKKLEETSVEISGRVDPERNGVNHGKITKCYFEWGLTTAYGHTVACQQSTPIEGAEEVTAEITGLTPITELPAGTTYHYRLIASNEKGATAEGTATAEGKDETFFTTAAPQIEGVSSSHVTATSAELEASVKPNGLPTKYRFQFGTTTAYGETTEEGKIEGNAEELSKAHSVRVPIEGLQRGVTYHFRAIATNECEAGKECTATSEDQNFEFFPPSCPNSAVRQQTGSAYLPDCRAYELVSPANANATLLSPGGPNTGQATSPSRFSYTGDFSSLPGTNTVETTGDLYVATRTDTGWVSRYIGLPGNQAACMGGPPTAPNSGDVSFQASLLTNTVLTDTSMSHFLDFIDGGSIECNGAEIFGEGSYQLDPPSGAPYLFGSEGTDEGRLPTDLGALPGALAAFQCPYENLGSGRGECSGETTASGDLTHLVFSSNQLAFAAGGLTKAPGSAYDDNLATGKVELISKLPETLGGGNIPQDPSFATVPAVRPRSELLTPGGSEEFLRFPAVSTDGSHILISTATAGTESCAATQGPYGGNGAFKKCPRFTETPVHLYMRVGGGLGGVTYEIAESPITHEPAAVNYVGMTPDGSKVYFTSEEHLTEGVPGDENPGHAGASLYMWEAEKAEAGEQPLTLISKAGPGSPPEAGDTAACEPALVVNSEGEEVPWTTKCGVLPVSTYSWSNQDHARGGNGISDTAIASRSGDIYFYSPEQLDGDRGVPGQQNLYDYREGRVRYVTTLTPEIRCTTIFGSKGACSEGPIVRIDVSPEDSHMAFLTASRLTSYDNAAHEEMYSYTPSTGNLVCDSCNPSGKPATAEVEASQDGLFMTDDGRTFFSTTEPLVARDTNEAEDVYEYVDGRPQLITPGTGTGAESEGSNASSPGLVGVSANGTDVYLSTFDTLISEDHNGDFLKFYDARTDGGFPQPPPTQPCAAAEECHGPGTEVPTLPTQGTAATLAGGNATSEHHAKHHKKKHKRAKHKRHHTRAAKHKRGGKK